MRPGTALTYRIASLVERATDGTVSRNTVLEQRQSLINAGISSLAYLRLIDAIENEFGVYVDLEDETAWLDTVADIADYVVARDIER